MKNPLLIAALVVGALLSSTAHATASNKELEARANDTDARVRSLESRVNQSLVDLQQQIEAARQELRTLRGQIEQAQHDLESAKQQQRDLYGELDRRLLVIENANGTQAPGSLGPPAPSDVVFADETAVYGDAFAALKAGRYDEAAKGFEVYLTKYPKGPKADNASYWLGESRYMQQDYAGALKAYQSVVSGFPESRKLPDALLKVGYCQYELKAFRNARATLQKVVSGFPDSDAATQAQQRLQKMDAEHR